MNDLKLDNTKVLLAEDEQLILEAMEDSFAYYGANVIKAENGQDALFKINNQQFDVIVTDINMPKVSGIELIHEIRQSSSIPIIVITAALVNTLEDIMEYSGVYIIKKPFDFDKVPHLVNKVLGTS